MADATGIEWCDTTINLWIGCTEVSRACDHCYARIWGNRFGIPWNAPPQRTKESSWKKIAAYQRSAKRFHAANGRPRRVFINSLSDFFDNQAPQDWRDRACQEMYLAPDVIFILVTKRPQNIRKMLPPAWFKAGCWPVNIWLVTTAENTVEYNRRVPHLMAIPKPAVLGISFEPLLEAIHLDRSMSRSSYDRAVWMQRTLRKPVNHTDLNRISWAIFGGESGKGARSMPPMQAVVSMMNEMESSGAAVFFKQLSAADFPRSYKDYSSFPRTMQKRNHPQ